MIKVLKVLLLTAAAVSFAGPALADVIEVRAAIPFDFLVADRAMPSGDYRFVTGDSNHGVVHISNEKGHVATVLCRPLAESLLRDTRLTFEKAGSEKFLRSIRTGDGTGVYLPATPREREAQALARAKAGAAAVAAR